MADPTRLAVVLAAISLCGACSTGPHANSEDDGAGDRQFAQLDESNQPGQAQSPCGDDTARDCYFEGMKLEAADKPEQALPKFEAACEAKRSSACYDLAVLYEDGTVVDQDETQAKKLYEQACRADDPDATACNNLAVMYQEGRAVEADQDEASKLYERSCQLGSMLGCRNLARRYLTARGVEHDPARAGQLLAKACKQGHPEACPQLTYLYAHHCVGDAHPGRTSGDQRCGVDAIDPDHSAKQLRQVCQKTGQPQACLGYGFMLESGFGGHDPNLSTAALQYDQACKANVLAGCNYLANLYRRGEGVERNTDRAVKLYQKACQHGFALSCHTLGVMNLRGRQLAPNPKQGFKYLRQACDGGRTSSCTALQFQCFLGRKDAC